LVRLPLSVAALVITHTWTQPASLPLLWLAVLLGYAIGRWTFSRMDVARYERLILLALGVAALAAITAAVT